MTPSARSLVALLALCTHAWSQSQWGGGQLPSPCLPFAPENRIGWLGTNYGNASAFGRIVTLELDADMAPDAVVVAGGVAVALFDPAYYDQPALIPGLLSVCDVAALPLGGDAERDLLLVTDANGLSSVGWSNGAFATPQLIARGSWTSASRRRRRCARR